MFKSIVFYGNSPIGEAEMYMKGPYPGPWIREIRISHFSPPSNRCPPLAVLHTIAPAGVLFKMESWSPPPPSDESPLISLYFACLREKKTAVVTLGEEELHLVAMPSRKNLMRYACFWSFSVVPRLYNSCLIMLNLRCLGIVFDLDETLIVANTMRSFEDKIDALQRKISNEIDPQRVTGMLAEIKRYQDDKSILKQYTENDHVVDNGKVFEVQPEIVPPLSDGHQLISRPVIRLQEKNIILTRVNPAIRDSSVLVRLRPAWKDLRSYLTAKGRKRFEVYVCTMAERDYALEMWRLLDPEANLINSRELLDRIICVKYGSRKSLLSVFQDGVCHPKMALGIDDRLKVWDEKDQLRVHVVPAFAPYYAPQAESNSSIPVLCVARNVACSVRGCFFKEFDEVLLPRIVDVFYEDEMINFPSAPDVGNYLITEGDTSAPNGNKDPLCNEGMEGVEIERRLKEVNCSVQAVPQVVNNFGPRPMSSLQHDMASSSSAVPLISAQAMMPLPSNHCSQPIASWPLDQSGLSEPSLQASPAREEGEVPESELDPNTRRRLLILHHGQDTREHHGQDTREHPPPPPFSVRSPPLQVSVPPVQLRGSWFPLGEGFNPRQLNRASREFSLEPDVRFDRNQNNHPSLFHGGENFIHSDRVIHESQRLPVQAIHGDDWSHPNHAALNYGSFPGEDMPMGRTSSNYRDVQLESGWATIHFADTHGILQEIAMKFGTKVEFRTVLCDSAEVQLSIEAYHFSQAWMFGEKMGEGSGKTRTEAQHQASERALQNLADKYLSNALFDPTAVRGDSNQLSHGKENGFISDSDPFGYPAVTRGGRVTSTSEESHFLDHKLEGSKKTFASVYALKELAAEEALGTLKSTVGQFAQKRSGSPRSLRTTPNKRLKQDFP